jgi:hypothetical protein
MSPGPRERRCSFAKCITDSTDIDLPNGTSRSPWRSFASRPMPVSVFPSQTRRILNSSYNLPAKASAASRTESHALLTLNNLVRSILLAEHRRRTQELIGKGMKYSSDDVAYSLNAQRSGVTEADKGGDASPASSLFQRIRKCRWDLAKKAGLPCRHLQMHPPTHRGPFPLFALTTSILSPISWCVRRGSSTSSISMARDFANLDTWIDSLDERIQHVLLQRISDEIDACRQAYSSAGQTSASDDRCRSTVARLRFVASRR